MSTLLTLLCLALSPAHADDDAASDNHAPAPTPAAAYDTALSAADALLRDGEPEAAAALADWIATQPDADQAAIAAQSFRQTVPDQRNLTWPKVRLIAFEAGYGAFTLGAGPGIGYWFEDSPALYPTLALLGGGIGTAGAYLLTQRSNFGTAHVHALVGSQQLATFNTMAIGALADDEQAVALGVIAGAVLGTTAGVTWALQDPDPVQTLGFHSGAFWGFGLGSLALGYAYAYDDIDGERIPMALAGAADIGAVVGLVLPMALPISEDHIRMANAGGFIGAASSFTFVALTSNIIWYAPHSVTAVVGGASIAGGALGVVLATRMNSRAPRLALGPGLIETHGRQVRLTLPVPRAMPVPGVDGDLAYGVHLIDQRF